MSLPVPRWAFLVFRFFAGNGPDICPQKKSPPYDCTWDTTKVEDDTHNLNVVITDKKGKSLKPRPRVLVTVKNLGCEITDLNTHPAQVQLSDKISRFRIQYTCDRDLSIPARVEVWHGSSPAEASNLIVGQDNMRLQKSRLVQPDCGRTVCLRRKVKRSIVLFKQTTLKAGYYTVILKTSGGIKKKAFETFLSLQEIVPK